MVVTVMDVVLPKKLKIIFGICTVHFVHDVMLISIFFYVSELKKIIIIHVANHKLNIYLFIPTRIILFLPGILL